MSETRFILRNIDVIHINRKYGFGDAQQFKTPIKDLEYKKSEEFISFLDDNKMTKRCIVSMVDMKTKTSPVKVNCFWDRQPIPETFQVIGCPIRFIPSQLVKRYHSEISKDKYSIKENISEDDLSDMFNGKLKLDCNNSDLYVNKRDCFLTDGSFCSFNCVVAFVEENKHNPLYKDSYYLIVKMYEDIFQEVDFIESAPSWRLLSEYGGSKDIKDFRSGFAKISYDAQGSWINSKMIPLGFVYEEKLRF